MMKKLLLLLLLGLAGPAQAVTITVPLTAGWNAVSFQGTHVTSVNGTNVAGLAYFNGTAYVVTSATPEVINEGQGTFRGFWIFCSAATGSLVYSADEGTATYTVNLTAGWNLVGFPSTQNVPGAQLYPYINGQLRPLASVILPQTYRLLPDGTSVVVDVTAGGTLIAGRPYWVYAVQACQLGFVPAGVQP